MIADHERRRRARALGVQELTIEKDHVLCCFLSAYADDPSHFAFRGGTALARVYWPDHRLSEDIDLIVDPAPRDTESWFAGRVAHAAGLCGLPLTAEFGRFRQGRSRCLVRWAGRQLLVDINVDPPALPLVPGRLDLPYSDLEGDRSVPTVSLAEILGSKWMLLSERREPRDLYDLWWGLGHASVPFSDVVAGYRARYRARPQLRSIDDATRRLGEPWDERLAHQIRDLPPFDRVVSEVRSAFDAWRKAQDE